MEADFGIEDLLREIEAQHQNDEGWSTREWAERLGYSVNKTKDILNQLWRVGKLHSGQRMELNMANKRGKVPVYRLKPRG